MELNQPKKRGRPRKYPLPTSEIDQNVAPKKRGRPKKLSKYQESQEKKLKKSLV
jgi:hypothetical protein